MPSDSTDPPVCLTRRTAAPVDCLPRIRCRCGRHRGSAAPDCCAAIAAAARAGLIGVAYRSHEATSNDAAERITCVRSWKPTTTAHPSSAGAASPVQSAPSRTMRPGCRAVHAAAVRRCCGPNSANGGAAKAQRTVAAAQCACAHGLMGCGLDRRRRHNGMALMDRVALARRSAVRRCFGAERRFGAAAPRVPRGAQRLLLVGYA